MDQFIRKKTESFSKKYCTKGKCEPKLWDDHVQLVRKYALLLAKKERADQDVVEIAALLHDIGKWKGPKGHDMESFRLSKEFLKGIDIPKKQKTLILKCVRKHGSAHSKEDNELEVKIIQSADALGTFFDEDWQAHSRATLPKDILLGLYDKSFKKINLASARKIVKPQIERLKKKIIEN